MKIVSNQEVKEYTNAIYTGFAKGCAVGAVITLGLYQVVKRKQFFQTMTVTTKTFFALSFRYDQPGVDLARFRYAPVRLW